MRRAVLHLLLASAAAGLLAASSAAADLVVRGHIVHTVAGEDITDGVVVVKDGKIVAVGPSSSVSIPAGVRVLEAAVVTPGLVDAHSVVGLTGYLNQPQDQDELDETAPVQPELRAIDSYDARERLIEWIRGLGVTTIHTGHAPGALISGQTLIAKTRGGTVDEAVIVPEAMVAATLGESAINKDEKKSPGTRSKLVSVLRAELIKAQVYQRKLAAAESAGKSAGAEKGKGADASKPAATTGGGKPAGGDKPDRDLHLEALGRVLKGEIPLLVTAQRHQDIESTLRVAKEFGIRVVLDGAAESYLLVEEIRAAGVPVIIHPTMARAAGEMENASMETAGLLQRAGIPVALQSGFEAYVPKTRVVLWEAAEAAAHGMGQRDALAAITLHAARIIGVADRVGSLEVGKDGDLALYDGDPFEWTTHCVGTVIEGEVVSTEVR